MNFLILANTRFNDAQEPAVVTSSSPSQGCRGIVSSDLCGLIGIATVERLEIIMLLNEMGPMSIESICARLGRDRRAIVRDLDLLLDLQIIDVDHDASYVFSFNGLCVVFQYPQSAPAGASGT
jgi:predicted transcriptional regulator